MEKHLFGSSGQLSTRVIFGAAALGNMKQDEADPILDLLLEYGVPPRHRCRLRRFGNANWVLDA
jgi:hypothetical protein